MRGSTKQGTREYYGGDGALVGPATELGQPEEAPPPPPFAKIVHDDPQLTSQVNGQRPTYLRRKHGTDNRG